MTFDNQTVLITGGGRGIGQNIALKFAELGANIILLDSNPDFDEIKKKTTSLGTKCLTFQADVTDFKSIEEIIKTISNDHENIDILVNNAGITKDELFMRMKQEQWNQVIDVNLNGIFNVTRAVIRQMVKQRFGKIINISSVVGFTGNPGQVNYSSTKSALIGFTKSLAREVGSRGITVNAVAPGFIDTPMTKSLSETQKDSIIKQIPLGRMGDADDIANSVVFLASKESSYITGSLLHVNGGMF